MGYPHTLRAELHKALSDAGIEYWVAQGITFWDCDDGRECLAYGYEDSDGTPSIAVKVVGIRDPQQAIDMTVGAGTCNAVLDEGYYRGINGVCEGLYCSKCKGPLSRRFKYCPECGAKVVSE